MVEPSGALAKDSVGRLPLHVACANPSEWADQIVMILLQSDPEQLLVRDSKVWISTLELEHGLPKRHALLAAEVLASSNSLIHSFIHSLLLLLLLCLCLCLCLCL
jgi:hypothetical protein